MCRKRIFILLAVLFVILSPLMAADGGSGSGDYVWGSDMNGVSNPFSVAFRFLQMVLISAATGALVSARFIINIIKAYYSSDAQEGGYKREIIKLVTTILIVLFAGVTLGFITGWIPTGSVGGGS